MQAVEAKWIEGSQETGEVVFVLQHSAQGFPSDVVRAVSLGLQLVMSSWITFVGKKIQVWILADSAFPFPWDVS